MKKFGIVLLVTLVGCVTVNEGGGDGKDGTDGKDGATGKSGVVSKRKAVDFTPAEKGSFCTWVAAEAKKAVGVYDCGDGVEITIAADYTAAQCEAELAANSKCEVSKIEGCLEILYGDPCAAPTAAACEALASCGADVSNPNNGTDSEFCYEHTVNDVTTGKKCFSTKADYCTSLCDETNFLSEDACTAECP